MHPVIRIIVATAGLFTSTTIHAQQNPRTEEELKALIKDLQKRSDSMQAAMKGKQQTKNTTPGNKQPAVNDGNDPDNIKFPAWDTARISTLPKKTMNASELRNYINDLYAQMQQRFSPAAVTEAKSIISKVGNDPAKLESAAMIAWYNGSQEEAALLITLAASRGDALVITNCGGLLVMNGLSEKAIPVLQTVVSYQPSNGIAMNNLAQAQFALGMVDSAMFNYRRCINLSPQHPQANAAAGVIELKKGNKSAAKAYFENSIRGGFNTIAYNGLRTIDKTDVRISHLINPKVKLPEYFNALEYKLPPQCYKVEEAAEITATQQAFLRAIGALQSRFSLLEQQAKREFKQTTDIAEINRQNIQKAKEGKTVLKPFQLLASIMVSELLLNYVKDIEQVEVFNKAYRLQYKNLEDQFKREYDALVKTFPDDDDCCGEGDISCCDDSKEYCRKTNALKNKYLEQFAILNTEWQSRNLNVQKQYFDNLIYWNYLASLNEADYRVRFYGWVNTYLNTLTRLAIVKVMEPCNPDEAEEKDGPEGKELKEFDCPFELSRSFIFGKVQLDCEGISIKGGELLIFKYAKNFKTGQSTMSIGGGWEMYGDKTELLGVEAGWEFGGSMSVFLNIDKDGNVSDGGIQYGLKAAAGIGFEEGEKLKFKKDIAGVDASIGWRIAWHAGLSFNEGPLRNYFNPKEVRKNKNVQIYQNNQ